MTLTIDRLVIDDRCPKCPLLDPRSRVAATKADDANCFEMVNGVDVSVVSPRGKLYTQCIAAVGALMMTLQTGIMGGWASPNIARLTTPNATIPLTLTEASWVASCLNLGRFVSAIIVPIFIELVGSKTTLLASFIPVAVGWAMMIFANSALWLYVARFLSGISFGMCYGCFGLYLGEVSVPAYRGTFVSAALGGAPVGVVLGTICETYLPMWISSSIYLVQTLAGIAMFLWLPDSPYHLVKTQQTERAKKSIAWYRGDTDLEKNFEQIASFVETYAKQSVSERLSQLRSRPVRRALVLVIVLYMFPQMCGLFNIIYYMEIILRKGKSFLVNPREFVIYANVVSVLATFVAIKLIDKSGRRPLFFWSSIIVTMAMLGLGTHFYLITSGVDATNLQWLPVVAILLFMFGYSIGFMIVPTATFSEIFPAGIKSTASSVTTFTSAFFGFVSAKSYQPMVDAFGESYVFWIHAGFSALGVPVMLFLMPETKGKTFQEIQDQLHKRS